MQVGPGANHDSAEQAVHTSGEDPPPREVIVTCNGGEERCVHQNDQHGENTVANPPDPSAIALRGAQ